ncbi:hypothetical protein AB6A40_003497 [Gnathostoma spinigerum]|uniref:ANK_REP_REGION domain-containing protein n=1 Tax=Gnathostoma spinigerum TaxID=75299 RepID=A0ABD6E9W4_9BILA
MPTKHEVNIKAPEVEVTWSTDVSKAKRCNSLTDSPCETSSSTSTVDSEELEFGRCKSKGTMTTDMPQSSEANVPNVSDKVVTLNNKNSPVSKSENHKNNNISVYPYVEAPNKLQSNKKQIHHQKKKKEKVSNEKTCSVDLSATTSVAEKGPTHGLVDMQQLLDRTVIQEPVRLTYTKDNGDHSLRLANSSVVKFYTTANCLHSLTESGESRLSKISVPLSTNERKLNIQTPSRIAEKSILSRDELENENLRKMIDDSYKMAQGCSRWIRSFHESLVDGNPAVFVNKFNCILRILRKSDDRERYKKMSDQQFREHVMLGILRRFMDEVEQTTVFHHLAATRNVDKPCSKRNHGSCRLIRLILSLLSWEDVRLFLRVKTKRTGKTALHMAAITGEQCQMEALMNFDVAPDILDCSGRAPLHYAVMRNSLDIVKLLLWYGADISLKERECTPVQLASLNPDTLDVCDTLSFIYSVLLNFF